MKNKILTYIRHHKTWLLSFLQNLETPSNMPKISLSFKGSNSKAQHPRLTASRPRLAAENACHFDRSTKTCNTQPNRCAHVISPREPVNIRGTPSVSPGNCFFLLRYSA